MRNHTAKWLVLQVLRRIKHGRLVIVDGDRRYEFGREQASPNAEITVHSPGFYRAWLGGSLGLAKAYGENQWDSDDLVALVQVGALNMPSLDKARRFLHPIQRPLRGLRGLLPYHGTRHRRKTATHYNLGNDLFELFLDPTMTYSCGVFEDTNSSMEDASRAKIDRVCRKLNLQPEDDLLEIGTGWGALAMHAAKHYGCRVTTTTISQEQHDDVMRRVRKAGLEDRIQVVLLDYRELTGHYDKLVSIEMIESIGWRGFSSFFAKCSDLLKPEGVMLLQAITIDDRAYEVEKAARSFINTLIFERGSLPSQQVVARAVAKHTDLRQVQSEDLTAHYSITLRKWRERFDRNEAKIAELGYDLEFRRIWRLYLAYCEAGFNERRILVSQALLAKPGFRSEPVSTTEYTIADQSVAASQGLRVATEHPA